jgi:hypothetical protein
MMMNEERENVVVTQDATPRWIGLVIVILAAVAIAALGIGWNASSHAKNVEQSLATQAQTLKQNQDALSQRLAQTEESNAQVQGQLNVVTGKLKLTQGELSSARRQAKAIKEENAKQVAALNTQIATKASADDLNKLGGDVNGVKTDLDSTKQNLQMARGEFGTLIARNHDEIDQLRRLGERNYYEFSLDRKGSRQKVGSLLVELRGTNPKRNLFSVALYVDDQRFEKKNRSVNEPIYFYSRGTRAPMEFVVNQVGKNKVVGYLSVPKSNEPSQSSQGSGGK